ncbi:hypothetical protein PWP93_28270 [Paraburkholderia sp. A1RI-2L]|uniref:hypothetical protein n=1 Tax=Paraburkholderia sp. A1RI-2L TaxID=3028367 RepID=UPI003B793166
MPRVDASKKLHKTGLQSMFFKFAKSIVFFGLMYFSLRYLGVAQHASLMIALIPLVLGVIGILAGQAFALTTLVFVGSALSVLLPPGYANGVDFVQKRFGHSSMLTVRDALQSAKDKVTMR